MDSSELLLQQVICMRERTEQLFKSALTQADNMQALARLHMIKTLFEEIESILHAGAETEAALAACAAQKAFTPLFQPCIHGAAAERSLALNALSWREKIAIPDVDS